MFIVRPNVTLILDNNITLQGHSQNTHRMVWVEDGGIFKMNNGATISGNNGGGVYLQNRGIFEMNGGIISGNTAADVGGGVHLNYGTFTMYGGTISGNTANNGGGVYVHSGTFTMRDGTISGNIARQRGGGVYAQDFKMRGGIIENNIAYEYGGGVYISSLGGSFDKTGGIIVGYNSDSNSGNAVRNDSGILARRGHTIYANENVRKETTAGIRDNLSYGLGKVSGIWAETTK